MTGLVEDDALVGGEQAIGPDVAGLTEAAGLEIFIGKSDGVSVADLLAGDLTQNQVVTVQLRDDKGGASFGLG